MSWLGVYQGCRHNKNGWMAFFRLISTGAHLQWAFFPRDMDELWAQVSQISFAVKHEV